MLHVNERSLRAPSFPVQLVDLALVELTNWRWAWRSMLTTGMITPVLSIMALGIFARDSGAEALAYVLTGNIVLSLMFENQDKVAGHFAFMRLNGILSYFSTLPVQKHALILAVVASFLLLSLPSLVITVILGSLLLDIPIELSPVILLVVPVCATSMAGVGALIGVSVRMPQDVGPVSLLVTFLMLGLGPVVIPPDRLPGVALFLGRFSPATYAASAARQALLGPLTGQIALDLAALVGFTLVTFWLVGRKMDWRQS
jgi:ABC-2 type transport system permease protein